MPFPAKVKRCTESLQACPLSNLSVSADALPPPLPRGGFGSPCKVNGFARGSPTRGAVERSETERLYEDGPALGSSLANLPHRACLPSEISPQNAKPPRSCDLPGGFPLVGLTVLVEFAKPLADVMRNYICHDRLQNCE